MKNYACSKQQKTVPNIVLFLKLITHTLFVGIAMGRVWVARHVFEGTFFPLSPLHRVSVGTHPTPPLSNMNSLLIILFYFHSFWLKLHGTKKKNPLVWQRSIYLLINLQQIYLPASIYMKQQSTLEY